jgi:hypothetical protein
MTGAIPSHTIQWEGTNDLWSRFACGGYFYRIASRHYS